MSKDFLDEMIEDWTRQDARFPDLLAEAERRRVVARQLAAKRQASGLSQTAVAARMKTAASVISKLEAGGDVKVSTLQRYCEIVGARVSIGLPAKPPRQRLKASGTGRSATRSPRR